MVSCAADVGRLLFGWLPEERPVEADGAPYGWAGVMSLPRQLLPYQVREALLGQV
jgi:hypothetical protein